MMRKVLALGALCAAMMMANAQISANLEQGGKLYWKFLSGQYNITGALTLSGDISASDPIELTLQDLNNDGLAIDIQLRIQDLFPTLGINRTLNLVGTVVSENSSQAIIRWEAEDQPNECIRNINVSGTVIDVYVTRLAGRLQALVRPIQCRTNPYNTAWQSVTLQFEENGGDDNNYLIVEGNLLCLQNPFTFARARVRNMNWEAYAGGFTGVFGNVNGDNVVDDADLLEVLFNFGSTGSDADANADGVVDDAALLIVLFNFGASC
ncbi:MAG: hypothetical protein N2651_09870 [Fimbriimonadales bacterium]|nr:hypothetical protein [Fimbriimonadales bacterium]